jgi:hypothetical protein
MMRGGGSAVLFAVLVVLSMAAPVATLAGLVAGATGGAGGATDATVSGNETIERTVTLRLTPERPSSIDATASFDLPESVTALTVSLPANATVTGTDGFERNGSRYRWDGETATPSVSVRVPANHSGVSHHGVNATGYTFVDAGDWALVRVPDVSARWWWDGAGNVTMTTNVTVAGDGVAADAIAYLGPHRTLSRSDGDRSVRLVVPAAARVEAGDEAVLDVLADATRALHLDDEDGEGGESVIVAAPQGVDWAVDGAQLGSTGAWVAADEPLSSPDDVWTHEYVHTRQSYRLAPEMAWFAEASAEYYAAALAVADGRVPYAAFRGHLAPQPGSDDGVLADPATWTRATVYRKGPTVLAALDARIRAATDGNRSLVDVSQRLNRQDDAVTLDGFLGAVERVAGPDVRAFADRAITTSETPDLPPAAAYDAGNESGNGSAGFRLATTGGERGPGPPPPAGG